MNLLSLISPWLNKLSNNNKMCYNTKIQTFRELNTAFHYNIQLVFEQLVLSLLILSEGVASSLDFITLRTNWKPSNFTTTLVVTVWIQYDEYEILLLEVPCEKSS